MLHRKLRLCSLPRLSVALAVCLAVAAGMFVFPSAWPADEIPSLTPGARSLPLTAVAENLGVRLEKQAQSHRLFIKRPERSARLICPDRPPTPWPRNPALQAFRSLPRGHLSAAPSRPNSPDDPSQPLLS